MNMGKLTYEGSDCSIPRPMQDKFASSVKIPWFTPMVTISISFLQSRESMNLLFEQKLLITERFIVCMRLHTLSCTC